MTAHKPKPVTLTPEVVEAFASYGARHEGSWGILHCQLEDGNFDHDVDIEDERETYDHSVGKIVTRATTDEERRLAAWWNAMTVSQRRRLDKRVQERRRLGSFSADLDIIDAAFARRS